MRHSVNQSETAQIERDIVYRLGTSEADILRSYPSLKAEDLANAWAYVRSHREEINKQIQENEAA